MDSISSNLLVLLQAVQKLSLTVSSKSNVSASSSSPRRDKFELLYCLQQALLHTSSSDICKVTPKIEQLLLCQVIEQCGCSPLRQLAGSCLVLVLQAYTKEKEIDIVESTFSILQEKLSSSRDQQGRLGFLHCIGGLSLSLPGDASVILENVIPSLIKSSKSSSVAVREETALTMHSIIAGMMSTTSTLHFISKTSSILSNAVRLAIRGSADAHTCVQLASSSLITLLIRAIIATSKYSPDAVFSESIDAMIAACLKAVSSSVCSITSRSAFSENIGDIFAQLAMARIGKTPPEQTGLSRIRSSIVIMDLNSAMKLLSSQFFAHSSAEWRASISLVYARMLRSYQSINRMTLSMLTSVLSESIGLLQPSLAQSSILMHTSKCILYFLHNGLFCIIREPEQEAALAHCCAMLKTELGSQKQILDAWVGHQQKSKSIFNRIGQKKEELKGQFETTLWRSVTLLHLLRDLLRSLGRGCISEEIQNRIFELLIEALQSVSHRVRLEAALCISVICEYVAPDSLAGYIDLLHKQMAAQLPLFFFPPTIDDEEPLEQVSSNAAALCFPVNSSSVIGLSAGIAAILSVVSFDRREESTAIEVSDSLLEQLVGTVQMLLDPNTHSRFDSARCAVLSAAGWTILSALSSQRRNWVASQLKIVFNLWKIFLSSERTSSLVPTLLSDCISELNSQISVLTSLNVFVNSFFSHLKDNVLQGQLLKLALHFFSNILALLTDQYPKWPSEIKDSQAVTHRLLHIKALLFHTLSRLPVSSYAKLHVSLVQLCVGQLLGASQSTTRCSFFDDLVNPVDFPLNNYNYDNIPPSQIEFQLLSYDSSPKINNTEEKSSASTAFDLESTLAETSEIFDLSHWIFHLFDTNETFCHHLDKASQVLLLRSPSPIIFTVDAAVSFFGAVFEHQTTRHTIKMLRHFSTVVKQAAVVFNSTSSQNNFESSDTARMLLPVHNLLCALQSAYRKQQASSTPLTPEHFNLASSFLLSIITWPHPNLQYLAGETLGYLVSRFPDQAIESNLIQTLHAMLSENVVVIRGVAFALCSVHRRLGALRVGAAQIVSSLDYLAVFARAPIACSDKSVRVWLLHSIWCLLESTGTLLLSPCGTSSPIQTALTLVFAHCCVDLHSRHWSLSLTLLRILNSFISAYGLELTGRSAGASSIYLTDSNMLKCAAIYQHLNPISYPFSPFVSPPYLLMESLNTMQNQLLLLSPSPSSPCTENTEFVYEWTNLREITAIILSGLFSAQIAMPEILNPKAFPRDRASMISSFVKERMSCDKLTDNSKIELIAPRPVFVSNVVDSNIMECASFSSHGIHSIQMRTLSLFKWLIMSAIGGYDFIRELSVPRLFLLLYDDALSTEPGCPLFSAANHIGVVAAQSAIRLLTSSRETSLNVKSMFDSIVDASVADYIKPVEHSGSEFLPLIADCLILCLQFDGLDCVSQWISVCRELNLVSAKKASAQQAPLARVADDVDIDEAGYTAKPRKKTEETSLDMQFDISSFQRTQILSFDLISLLLTSIISSKNQHIIQKILKPQLADMIQLACRGIATSTSTSAETSISAPSLRLSALRMLHWLLICFLDVQDDLSDGHLLLEQHRALFTSALRSVLRSNDSLDEIGATAQVELYQQALWLGVSMLLSPAFSTDDISAQRILNLILIPPRVLIQSEGLTFSELPAAVLSILRGDIKPRGKTEELNCWSGRTDVMLCQMQAAIFLFFQSYSNNENHEIVVRLLSSDDDVAPALILSAFTALHDFALLSPCFSSSRELRATMISSNDQATSITSHFFAPDSSINRARDLFLVNDNFLLRGCFDILSHALSLKQFSFSNDIFLLLISLCVFIIRNNDQSFSIATRIAACKLISHSMCPSIDPSVVAEVCSVFDSISNEDDLALTTQLCAGDCLLALASHSTPEDLEVWVSLVMKPLQSVATNSLHVCTQATTTIIEYLNLILPKTEDQACFLISFLLRIAYDEFSPIDFKFDSVADLLPFKIISGVVSLISLFDEPRKSAIAKFVMETMQSQCSQLIGSISNDADSFSFDELNKAKLSGFMCQLLLLSTEPNDLVIALSILLKCSETLPSTAHSAVFIFLDDYSKQATSLQIAGLSKYFLLNHLSPPSQFFQSLYIWFQLLDPSLPISDFIPTICPIILSGLSSENSSTFVTQILLFLLNHPDISIKTSISSFVSSQSVETKTQLAHAIASFKESNNQSTDAMQKKKKSKKKKTKPSLSINFNKFK